MQETYLSGDTNPFGSNVAFRILQNSFPDNYIRSLNSSYENTVNSFSDSAAIYFCVAKYFFTKEQDIDGILDFVDKGNTFFLSAAYIDSNFLQRIYCKVKNEEEESIAGPLFRNTSVRLAGEPDTTKQRFSYFYEPFSSSFSAINNIYCRIIGYNEKDEPNCIVFFWGKGKLFLHTDPRVFSNYFLLKNNNHLYLQQLLQLLDQAPEHIYWNDYNYQSGNSKEGFFGLDAILKSPPLAAAFWITLAMLLLFILFGIKRRQRIIKQIPPKSNSSIAFTETIARLYLQENDNKNIAEKMITYFNEYIRANYFLHVNAASHDFIEALSRKSGVSLEKTTLLFSTIEHVNQTSKLDDYQLLSLNNQIQQFYKNRK